MPENCIAHDNEDSNVASDFFCGDHVLYQKQGTKLSWHSNKLKLKIQIICTAKWISIIG